MRKYETLEDAAKRIVKDEINLDVRITPEDQLFTDTTIFPEQEVHTINTVYLARTDTFEQIKQSLRADSGNTTFALFDKIDPNLHQYVKKAITKAWGRVFNESTKHI